MSCFIYWISDKILKPTITSFMLQYILKNQIVHRYYTELLPTCDRWCNRIFWKVLPTQRGLIMNKLAKIGSFSKHCSTFKTFQVVLLRWCSIVGFVSLWANKVYGNAYPNDSVSFGTWRAPGFLKSLSLRKCVCVCVCVCTPRGHKITSGMILAFIWLVE